MAELGDLSNVDREAREEIARKVGKILSRSDNATDQKAALELAQVLAEDVAVSVRSALSKELKTCIFLPKELVSTIIKDIDEVSLPFLIAAEAMDDAFLEEIVRNHGSLQQEAVAERSGLSEIVSFALADVGSLKSVEILAENDTADLSERSYNRVMERFPDERSLLEVLAVRSDVPSEIIERLIFKVSQRYGKLLVTRFNLSDDYAQYLISLAKRSVFSRFLEMAPLSDIINYFDQLHAVDGLGSNELLTYLQNKNARLFTAALSVLLDKPYGQIEAVVSQRDKKLLARLLETAGFTRSVIGVLLISYDRLL